MRDFKPIDSDHYTSRPPNLARHRSKPGDFEEPEILDPDVVVGILCAVLLIILISGLWADVI